MGVEGFGTSEVSKLTGLTRRQLDHWDRTGVFKPSLVPAEGRGSARIYSFLDVVELRVARWLLDAGLSMPRLRKCLEFLRDNLKNENLSTASLVTNGTDVFLLTSDEQSVVSLLQRGQVVWAVNLAVPIHLLYEGYQSDSLNAVNL